MAAETLVSTTAYQGKNAEYRSSPSRSMQSLGGRVSSLGLGIEVQNPETLRRQSTLRLAVMDALPSLVVPDPRAEGRLGRWVSYG